MTRVLNIRLNPLLLVCMLIGVVISPSCQDQVKKEANKTERLSPLPNDNTPSDFDPYFIETEGVYSPDGPSSITRNILEDKAGDIWLATWEGIIHYDGETFTNYTNMKELRRHRIFCILEDSEGILWFGSIGAGVYRYDGTDFTNYTTKEGLVNDRVGCIFEDIDGNIWFGTEKGLSRYDGETFTNYTEAEGVPNGDINTIIQDHTGKLWIGSRGEAFTFNGQTFETIVRNRGMTFQNVRCILECDKNEIWLGGNDGLWQWDGKKFLNHATNFTGYIYEDRAGYIWTSSVDPENRQNWVLSRYSRYPLVFNKMVGTQITSGTDMYFGITEDSDGGLWFGSLNGVKRLVGDTIDDFSSGHE